MIIVNHDFSLFLLTLLFRFRGRGGRLPLFLKLASPMDMKYYTLSTVIFPQKSLAKSDNILDKCFRNLTGPFLRAAHIPRAKLALCGVFSTSDFGRRRLASLSSLQSLSSHVPTLRRDGDIAPYQPKHPKTSIAGFGAQPRSVVFRAGYSAAGAALRPTLMRKNGMPRFQAPQVQCQTTHRNLCLPSRLCSTSIHPQVQTPTRRWIQADPP